LKHIGDPQTRKRRSNHEMGTIRAPTEGDNLIFLAFAYLFHCLDIPDFHFSW